MNAKRVYQICKEFDERVREVGVRIARLELAKKLAMAEAAHQQSAKRASDCHATGTAEPAATSTPKAGKIPRTQE